MRGYLLPCLPNMSSQSLSRQKYRKIKTLTNSHLKIFTPKIPPCFSAGRRHPTGATIPTDELKGTAVTDNVIKLGTGVKVTDIPGQLRRLADQIESGEVETDRLLAIIPRDNQYPVIYGWGEMMSAYERLGVMAAAQFWIAQWQILDDEADE